ncbi:hypothetical protein Tco_0446136 [Tanacetum coccineum]
MHQHQKVHSNRSHANYKITKAKEIAKPITPPSGVSSEEDSNPEQAMMDKDMAKRKIWLHGKVLQDTLQTLPTSTLELPQTPEQECGILLQGCSSSDNCLGYKCLLTRKEIGSLCQGMQKVKTALKINTDEDIDEQELEAHYCYMAKIQEVSNADSGTNAEPLEQDDQNDVECDDERVALVFGIVALQNKQTELERFKAFNDRTVDYDKLERRLNETLGLLAQKEIDIKESLKVKGYEILVVKEKHDELVKQSLLTKSHYEGLVKEKTKHGIKIQNDLLHLVKPNCEDMEFLVKGHVDELESDKQNFPTCMILLLLECVSKMLYGSYLQSSSDLDEITELQCLYLHKVRECDCLAQKLSEQTEFVSKEIYTELLRSFAKLEKHSISLEIALQECQEQLKNDTVCKEMASAENNTSGPVPQCSNDVCSHQFRPRSSSNDF